MSAQSSAADSYIKGIAVVQLVIALLLGIFGLFSINRGVNMWFAPPPATAPIPDPHSTSQSVAGGFGMLYLALLCIWLASNGRFMRRSLRPVGISLSAWFTLKLVAISAGALYLMPLLGDMVFQYQDRSVRLGDAIGGLLTGITVALVLVTLCLAALFLFYRSRAVAAALDRADGARYWTDRVPLSLVFGGWMFAALALETLGDLNETRQETWFGLLYGLPAVAVQLLAIALLASLAWGFCRRRAWAWWLALAASPLWLLFNFFTSIQADDPDFLKYKDYLHGMDLVGLMNRFIPVGDAISCVQFALFLAYLLAVKRLFQAEPVSVSTQPVLVMADPAAYWKEWKRFMVSSLLAPLMLILHHYSLAMLMLLPFVLLGLFSVVTRYVPALEFGPDAVILRLHSYLTPPEYPYSSLKQVHLLTTWPKGTRSYDSTEQRLNLLANTFTPTGVEAVKAGFQAHGIVVVVEKPVTGSDRSIDR